MCDVLVDLTIFLVVCAKNEGIHWLKTSVKGNVTLDLPPGGSHLRDLNFSKCSDFIDLFFEKHLLTAREFLKPSLKGSRLAKSHF